MDTYTKYTLNYNEIRMALEGRRIYAIKSVRERFNCGLKEAKEAVEEFLRQVGAFEKTPCRYCNGCGYQEEFTAPLRSEESRQGWRTPTRHAATTVSRTPRPARSAKTSGHSASRDLRVVWTRH